MEYGYTYNPVINEQNTPGIWQSDLANFPATFQKGRILVASDTGAIYLDLVSSRIILVNSHSNLNFANGLTKTDLPNNVGQIYLGGELEQDTGINGLGNFIFSFVNLINFYLTSLDTINLTSTNEMLFTSGTNVYQCGIQNIVRSLNGINADGDGNIAGLLSLILFQPVTGNTINLVSNQYNVIEPAAAILALTLNFPAANEDDTIEIKFTKAVSTVTYTGGTIAAPITVAVIGTYLKFVYGGGKWY
jgi:hypothetical protein